jgi:exosortase/archaeosortase family protein
MSNHKSQNPTISREQSGFAFEKSTFLTLFLIAAIILLMLPFFTTFNEFLTKIIEKSYLYQPIQKYIVPFFTKMIGALLVPFGVKYTAYLDGMTINGVPIGLTWNCLGWQSLVLLLVTFLTGLTGNYTKFSKFECVMIGILGTFLVNIFRITFTALLAAYWGQLFAIVFHDYFATFITLIWLFVFWWFSYGFVLQNRRS